MVYKIPTAKETYDQILSTVTAALNVTVPKSPKSFTKIWSAISSTVITSLYKYANDQLKNLLISTATRTGLIVIGNDYGIPIKAATYTTLEIEIAAYNGAVIDLGKEFIGDFNGLSYFPEITVTATGVTVTLNIVSQTTGTDNNMGIGDTLTLASPIPGVGQTATVTDVIEDAIDEEDIEVYRSRLFYAKRNRGGGGNAYDYKLWGEEVEGVKMVEPITGLPFVDEGITFEDGDCEKVGTADWSGATIAITKQSATPFEGSQYLQGDPNPGGGHLYQSGCLTIGQGYVLKGYARFPVLPGGVEDRLYFTGGPGGGDYGYDTLTSTGWTYFEVEFIAITTAIGFYRYSDELFHLDAMTIEPSVPIQRTIFVEAVSSISAEGLAPQYLLDEVKENILVDPITGYTRPPMGHGESSLYVDSITRDEIEVQITDLLVDSALEAACKNQLDTDLDTYFRSVKYYNAAIDSELDRNDVVTKSSIGNIVYSVVSSYGGSVSGIEFNTTVSFPGLTSYHAIPGTLLKLHNIYYA